jgi:hypothetical protein
VKFDVDCNLSCNQFPNLSVDVFDFVGVLLVNDLLFHCRLSGWKHCNLLLQQDSGCMFAKIALDECIREIFFEKLSCPFRVTLHTFWPTYSFACDERLVADIARFIITCRATNAFSSFFCEFFAAHAACAVC